jgi:hypothetical protein
MNTNCSSLLDYFDEVRIINLLERKDRRREMQQELSGLGSYSAKKVRFFDAVRPLDQGSWPSVGALGCFLSHQAILREALLRSASTVLVLEDDCSFTALCQDSQKMIVEAMAERPWDILYLGHQVPITETQIKLMRWQEPLMTSHSYAMSGSCVKRFVPFLELLASRPPGHPDGGPQHYDGALSTFRFQNPDIATFICAPSLAYQRSSRSNVSPVWFDLRPGVRQAATVLRHNRRTMRLSRKL